MVASDSQILALRSRILEPKCFCPDKDLKLAKYSFFIGVQEFFLGCNWVLHSDGIVSTVGI